MEEVGERRIEVQGEKDREGEKGDMENGREKRDGGRNVGKELGEEG